VEEVKLEHYYPKRMQVAIYTSMKKDNMSEVIDSFDAYFKALEASGLYNPVNHICMAYFAKK
jgi:hypothetical protein